MSGKTEEAGRSGSMKPVASRASQGCGGIDGKVACQARQGDGDGDGRELASGDDGGQWYRAFAECASDRIRDSTAINSLIGY